MFQMPVPLRSPVPAKPWPRLNQPVTVSVPPVWLTVAVPLPVRARPTSRIVGLVGVADREIVLVAGIHGDEHVVAGGRQTVGIPVRGGVPETIGAAVVPVIGDGHGRQGGHGEDELDGGGGEEAAEFRFHGEQGIRV